MTHAEVLSYKAMTVTVCGRAPLSQRFATRRNFGREAVPAMRYQAGRAEADGTAGRNATEFVFSGGGRGEFAGPV